MKRIVHIAKSHEEARKWDIKQALEMTSEQRQAVAREIRERVFGKETPDVRAWYRSEKEK